MGEVCGTFGTKCDSLFFYRVGSVQKVRTEGWSDSRGKRQCLPSLVYELLGYFTGQRISKWAPPSLDVFTNA